MSKISYREEVNRVNSPHSCTLPGCILYAISRDAVIDIKRWKRDTGIQYRQEKKEDIAGFIPKPITRPEYGTVYQHQGMLLQNLHCRYLYIVIQLPHLKDLDQKIPSFPNCDNYGIHRASNPNPLNDDKTGHEEHNTRSRRAIPLLAIAQGTAAIGGMLIKGRNALVDAKRANSFNNAIKMLNANVEITHTDLSLLKTKHQ